MLMHQSELERQVLERQERLHGGLSRVPRRSVRVRIGRALIAIGSALAGSERPVRHAPTRPAKPAHQHG